MSTRKPPAATVEELIDEEDTRFTRKHAMGSKEQLPSREVPPHMSCDTVLGDIDPIFAIDPVDPSVEVWPTMFDPADPKSVFTRSTDPFNPICVAAILEQVTIGSSLSPEQRHIVITLLTDFADCFALSVSEVKHVDGAFHHLDIPANATFNMKPRQRPLTPPQRKFFNGKVDEMLEAGIIEAVHPSHIKAVSPTTLAQKAHEGGGLTLDELKHRVNDECLEAGLASPFDLPPRPATCEPHVPESRPQKWRVCQNFNEVNKVTHVAPMPQGDIRAKQQRLSGHKYLSIFDFAAGFYAVETAKHLHDLLTNSVMELLIDDGGVAADTFEDMLEKLHIIFNRVCEHNLSLSPSKSSFFMTEAVFAGARVGPDGILPDLTKLTAIVDWAQPTDALNLMSFLGLTGHFRDLIRNYARIEGPLRNMLRDVSLPNPCSKLTYRRLMQGYMLTDRWTARHTEAFLALKAALTQEPVLRGPRWDGTPFIVTSDGCKDGFAAVLTQEFETTLPKGNVVRKLHPIAFASKRTSRAEEKYMPFLLEFAALKFALDKFSDILWGFPVIVETDCQALRDVLLSGQLNATHARWHDGILAYQIIDVRHVPGRLNVVADGLSRQSTGHARAEGDGSEWSVGEDWEVSRGLVNDVLLLTVPVDPVIATLRDRFAEEPLFREVVDALTAQDQGTNIRDKRHARHRAMEYFIEDGRLYRLHGGTRVRARPKLECVTKTEAKALAYEQHITGGHWGRDHIKIALLDRICCPGLDASILAAVRKCTQCKSFGAPHLHSLLEPITRRRPFELLVGDYLSMPPGKNGFVTVGLYLDVFSQHVWASKFKKKNVKGADTVSSLQHIFSTFVPSETFMSDGGKHFHCAEVRDFCARWECKTHIVTAYSPWVNGLVEGTNKLLLHVLSCLITPGLGEHAYCAAKWKNLPNRWPEFLDKAIVILNNRLLPGLKFSPKELLFGLVVNKTPTPLEDSMLVLRAGDVDMQMAYVAQQCLNGYEAMVNHAIQCKSAFDRRLLKGKPGEVLFSIGQLVQVYRSDLSHTFKVERKLLAKWSQPHRITGCIRNSYTLATLAGEPYDRGKVSARRLWAFVPKPGSMLDVQQNEFEAHLQDVGLAEPGSTDVDGADEEEDKLEPEGEDYGPAFQDGEPDLAQDEQLPEGSVEADDEDEQVPEGSVEVDDEDEQVPEGLVEMDDMDEQVPAASGGAMVVWERRGRHLVRRGHME
ncbi:hypothetical protein EWM64_g8362 [Hericium alpestre]|uniref:Integrase catalytic domain-containing protein n=1 Tax=Hericium alpestre TaxID=135208 RepID=A0A4Y9ZN11_9AGAM|nr:hypothetical protein EWM64_g8362 [Hericium alpestre]